MKSSQRHLPSKLMKWGHLRLVLKRRFHWAYNHIKKKKKKKKGCENKEVVHTVLNARTVIHIQQPLLQRLLEQPEDELDIDERV